MIRSFYRKRKPIAVFFIALHLVQIVGIRHAFALTSGPSQPEVQSFQPAGTTEMVDLFSGDFSYNIPLFELPGPNGGYPFNLSYQAGSGMDTEASWVGLGFSLQPGAINRQMRGLPDEFKGDDVYTKMSIEPNVTVGLSGGGEVEVFGKAIGLSVGLSVYQNNYKGMGYTIGAGMGFGKSVGGGMTQGIGLNFSLDSKEGVSASPSLSLNGKLGTVGLGTGYNSKSGLSSMTLSYKAQKDLTIDHKNAARNNGLYSTTTVVPMNASATLSLAHPGYTPQVSMPMQNASISATFKPGTAMWGVFGEAYIKGFYSDQRLKDNKRKIKSDAFGYLHYEDAVNDRDLRDFNREKDGMVTKGSPNLAIPSLTYDIYSVTGQGIGTMYRPMRNDIGIIHDQETTSSSVGGAAGVDVGVPSHVGVNLSVNHAKSTSGAWIDNNEVRSTTNFQGKNPDDLYEPWYFKAHGEPSSESTSALNALGGANAVRVRLAGDDFDAHAENVIETGTGWRDTIPHAASYDRERKVRNQVIQPITNEQLMRGNEEVMPVFKIRYIDQAGQEQAFSRSSLPKHHTAGFTALTPEGLRYNYGIPAYNLHHEEVTFSARKQAGDVSRVNAGNNGQGDPTYQHKNTDKFLKRVEMPKYAHAYLLTSIVGPDYVDVLNDGVTKDDLGYWVKFTYQKTTADDAPYEWRDPFSKAHYQEGWKTDPRDDRGSFVYGKKELWYLVKAETKSHIATFNLKEREDGKGVAAKLQDIDNKGKSVYALEEIKLFTRSAGSAHPVKVVKFEYDYSLCKGVFNSSTEKGKLTLKRLWFEYGNSKRGSLNPYIFIYPESTPDYSPYAYDRWGNYKPYPAGDPLYNIDFPYAEQDPSKKDEIDRNATAWNLKEIKLPSGGKVIVDYETDDYAYVQHEQAMQMTQIAAPGDDPSAASFTLNDNNLKVRFKLEQPVSASAVPRTEVLKYIDQERKQLYFKMKINLRKPGNDLYEYISGYVDIDVDKVDGMGLEGQDGSGKYMYGFFHVKADDGHNPFAMRAWQHLRTNQPDLAMSGKLEQTDNANKRVEQIKKLGSVFGEVRKMFTGFNNYCHKMKWGREVITARSWVRLNSPDKMKYGGGCRVRQITLMDAWAQDKEGVYGQVYEYTTQEGNETISSGVAAYEPMIGGEENALRYAKKYTESVPLRADNNMFFEYPINESYYPGPQVGYRKVTVNSLAAASLARKNVKNITLPDGGKLFPSGTGISYGTTGETVHEFYTAREFPVITDETGKVNKPFNLSFVVPFLGSISISKLSTSQGYSIVTNDMHGKVRKVSNYRQDGAGKIDPQPVSWVKYNYACDSVTYQKKQVCVPANVLKDNGDGTLSLAAASRSDDPSITKYTIGQEHEFFIDMRQFEDRTWSGGVCYNLDMIYLLFGVIPVPATWPDISNSKTLLRTAVTNKVIFKSGILESTEAYDGGSHVTTENIKWDKLTGVPVLTIVNNNFEAPVYNYSTPAYTQYQGMGAAYQNVGLTFTIDDVDNLPYHDHFYQFTSVMADALFPGDEIILYRSVALNDPVARVIFAGEENGDKLLYADVALTETKYSAMIVRSGYRNQLGVSAGNVTALEDPSKPGANVTYTKTITIPNED